jgi:hypothetical protein
MSEHHAGRLPQQQFARGAEPADTPPERGRGHDRSLLARLAVLHDEAEETAELANLVGRTPWLAALLVAGALGIVAMAPLAAALGSALLIGVCAGGLLVLFHHAMAAPFDLGALRAFYGAMRPALMLAGAVWGGVALTAIGPNPLISLVFFAGVTALAAAFLRLAPAALAFAVPASLAAGAAAAIGTGGAGLALASVGAGILIVAATLLAARITAPKRAGIFPLS